MSGFNDREKAFEDKFKHDKELEFKVQARRNKLLGLWAAGQMGITGGDAEAYAKDVVRADFEKPGDGDVLEKVLGDLQGKGIDATRDSVRYEMDKLLDVAAEQVKSE